MDASKLSTPERATKFTIIGRQLFRIRVLFLILDFAPKDIRYALALWETDGHQADGQFSSWFRMTGRLHITSRSTMESGGITRAHCRS